MKIFFANWKTAVPGMLAALCASDSILFHVMSPEWSAKAGAFCTFLLAVGLIAAKDADKSNAPRPESAPVKVLPVALLALVALGMSGCASLNGTMLDGRACTFWTASDVAEVAEEVARQYPDGTTRRKVEDALAYAAAAQMTGTAFCEMLRAIEGLPPDDAVATMERMIARQVTLTSPAVDRAVK